MSATAVVEPASEATRERILAAAVGQCEEVGLRRTTMEDIARRAGLARATLYRHFESKDALVRAVILAEAQRFFAALDVVIADVGRAERLVEGFAFALEYAREHALLNKLLRTEPETLLPHLLRDGRLVSVASDGVAQRIGSGGQDGVDSLQARAVAELAVRLVLSLALSPQSELGADDAEGARRLARRHLVGSLCGDARGSD
jgi:AcrR family transcriptional regulator